MNMDKENFKIILTKNSSKKIIIINFKIETLNIKEEEVIIVKQRREILETKKIDKMIIKIEVEEHLIRIMIIKENGKVIIIIIIIIIQIIMIGKCNHMERIMVRIQIGIQNQIMNKCNRVIQKVNGLLIILI